MPNTAIPTWLSFVDDGSNQFTFVTGNMASSDEGVYVIELVGTSTDTSAQSTSITFTITL